MLYGLVRAISNNLNNVCSVIALSFRKNVFKPLEGTAITSTKLLAASLAAVAAALAPVDLSVVSPSFMSATCHIEVALILSRFALGEAIDMVIGGAVESEELLVMVKQKSFYVLLL